MIVDLNGRQIDLSKALPMVIKDWKALQKLGWSLQRMNEMSITDGALLAFYMLRKSDPSTTQAEIDELLFTHPAVQKCFEVFKDSMEPSEDKPTPL